MQLIRKRMNEVKYHADQWAAFLRPIRRIASRSRVSFSITMFFTARETFAKRGHCQHLNCIMFP